MLLGANPVTSECRKRFRLADLEASEAEGGSPLQKSLSWRKPR